MFNLINWPLSGRKFNIVMSKKVQFGHSIGGNLKDRTWEFEITSKDFELSAGKFAILTAKEFEKLLNQRDKLLIELDSAVTGLEWEIENTPEKDHKADEEKIQEWKKLIQSIENNCYEQE